MVTSYIHNPHNDKLESQLTTSPTVNQKSGNNVSLMGGGGGVGGGGAAAGVILIYAWGNLYLQPGHLCDMCDCRDDSENFFGPLTLINYLLV